MSNDTWDHRFMELAELVGSWSKDRSRKVGAVLVGPRREVRGVGYNGFPRGVNDDDDDRHTRPAKYSFTSHAEQNVVCNCASIGTSTLGCTLYVSNLFPCAECARAVIQSGIERLVCRKPDMTDAQWADSFRISFEMLEEAGVSISYYDDDPLSADVSEMFIKKMSA